MINHAADNTVSFKYVYEDMFSLVFTILHVCFWVIYCEVCNRHVGSRSRCAKC